jgi:hypothetical protein
MRMEPPFAEMMKVRVTNKDAGPWEGYVIASTIKDGRWIIKVSLPDGSETFDNWYPADWLERVT